MSYVDPLENVRVRHDVVGDSAAMRWNSGRPKAVARASVDSQTATFIRSRLSAVPLCIQGDEPRLGGAGDPKFDRSDEPVVLAVDHGEREPVSGLLVASWVTSVRNVVVSDGLLGPQSV